MEKQGKKQINYLVLGGVVLVLIVIFFVFYSSSSTTKQTDIVNRVEKSTQKRGKSISLDKVKKYLEKEAKKELSGTKYRLGKIKALHIDTTGKATSWTFTYVYSKTGDKTHIYEKPFRWYKGKIKTGVEQRILKSGLDTPNYDYLFKEIDKSWIKPKEIIKKAIKIYGHEDESTGYGLYLYWQTDILKSAPIYVVDPYFIKEKKLYFNAETGENIK